MRSIMIEEQHSPGALCARFVLLMIMTLAPAGFASADEIGDLKAGVVKITAKVDGKTRVGTGIIVRLESDAAHIVTASHVIEGDPHPNVSFFTRPNRPLDAKVVGMEGGDPRGLAALLVEGEIPSGLRALWIDPTAELSGGEPVALIGFPRRLGTAWAITIGSISGLRGRDITFQAPADEGNSGGPLIMHGKVVGVVTESRGQFGFAVPTPIVRVALSSWGVRLALEGGGAASPERSASTTDAAALGGAGGGQGRASDISASSGSVMLTGTWKHVANPLLSYVFEQEGRTVNMVEITTNMFGSAVTAQGEGELEGRTVTLSYITTVGTNGKSVLMLSEDGETMSGSFTDLVTGMTMPLSLAREASGADIFGAP